MPPPPRWNCSKPSGSDASTSTIWRWPTGSERASGSSRAIQRSFRSTPLTTRPGRLAGAGVKAAGDAGFTGDSPATAPIQRFRHGPSSVAPQPISDPLAIAQGVAGVSVHETALLPLRNLGDVVADGAQVLLTLRLRKLGARSTSVSRTTI